MTFSVPENLHVPIIFCTFAPENNLSHIKPMGRWDITADPKHEKITTDDGTSVRSSLLRL